VISTSGSSGTDRHASVARVGERLAVIGGDAAGMSAASAAKRRDPGLEVVAFERGPYTSYSACGIPFWIGRHFEDSDRLVSRSADEHRANGLEVHIRTEVVGIDLDRRELTVRDHHGEERREGFDQLVVATGAHATPPPVPGAGAAEPARTIDAAERFDAELQRRGGRCAVVVGGGYIGLEMAEALLRRDLDVTLVELGPQLFPALDEDMAEHVLDAAEGEGIDVRLDTPLEEVLLGEDGRPRGVRAGGEEIPCRHVVLATGVRPATELAREAGLAVGASGALVVDDRMRCRGHDGVFAAGDCVESFHRVLQAPRNVQLGTHANKQGRIAGVNATGGDVRFPGVIGTAVSRICRYEVGRTGVGEAEAREAGMDVVATTIRDRTRAGYYPGAGPIWVKLVAERGSGRLVGGQIVGVEGAAKRIDVLAACVWTEMAVDELELLDLGYAPPYSGVYDPVLVAARAVAKLA
jgi:NADPH-dependent 2,4-dienoyl-CoA reductase/sulfur reductase-like enzyme